MDSEKHIVRKATSSEFEEIGKLMVEAYSQLEGFPKPSEQPGYYKMLAAVGEFADKPKAALLTAVSSEETIEGGVVYFGDMQYYGSGGIATQEKNTSGFRLLAVSPSARGKGIGRLLTEACINKAREDGNRQMIIHTTMAMQLAWKMYEHMGFKRSEDLDFMQGELAVYGFRLHLE